MNPMQAHNKCYFTGHLTRAEAESIIEKATIGDPAGAAYRMVHNCGSNRSWAEAIIENATIGDPSWSAYRMVRDCGSDRAWAEGVIESATIGGPAQAAYWMVQDCGSDRSWAEDLRASWAKSIGPHRHEWIPHLRRDGTQGRVCSVCDREDT